MDPGGRSCNVFMQNVIYRTCDTNNHIAYDSSQWLIPLPHTTRASPLPPHRSLAARNISETVLPWAAALLVPQIPAKVQRAPTAPHVDCAILDTHHAKFSLRLTGFSVARVPSILVLMDTLSHASTTSRRHNGCLRPLTQLSNANCGCAKSNGS